MSKLLEQIQADAEARLVLPPNRHPNEEKPRYRKYLDLETHRLKLAHRDGGSGLEICHARARMLDLVFCHLMQAATALERFQAPGAVAPHALVAIGGYGRAELNPHSDVDIMFLHSLPEAREDSPLPFLELMSRTMLMFDLFPKVGYSVRNLDDCVRVANSDMQSQTSLIEARLICGDRDLFERFQQTVRNKCIKGKENAYIEARMEDQASRRAKYGDSASLQEPNIKNGCGGLRDYQNLIWMARFRYGCLAMTELRDQGMVSEPEQRQLDTAYDFLLRVRNELHYHVDRPVDKLTRDVQPAVARNLGYTDRSLAQRVERFMGEYYQHARNIHLITRTVEHRLAMLPQPRRLPTLKQFLHRRRKDAMYAVDGFKFVRGEVHPAAGNIFEEEPARLMRVFRQAQLRGASLGPDIACLIRNSLHRVTPEFRKDPHVHETFLEILRQKGSVARVLREMHEVGLLGAFLPVFGRLTGRVQHEFYHIFTTDEHTLVCLEMLDLLHGTEDPTLEAYGELLQDVERPELLYLGLLLHDVGKGRRTSDHSETGSRMAASVARKLGLARPDVDTISFLVRHHLAMIQTGLKRDLDSPDEIERFAQLVQNEENLRLLTLLTVADTRGTSATLWNGFKNTMLRKLLVRTREQLRGKVLSERADKGRREALATEVWERAPDNIGRDEFDAHFQ
ncbi:MAG: [protein-PII] uridylyltransferase, partial [Verrucomicrobiae bacterium]|nr:[protein-PII] uridylyltransferase [Verrucomicrobiae bacterium]